VLRLHYIKLGFVSLGGAGSERGRERVGTSSGGAGNVASGDLRLELTCPLPESLDDALGIGALLLTTETPAGDDGADRRL
jgi:hypothetical protein